MAGDRRTSWTRAARIVGARGREPPRTDSHLSNSWTGRRPTRLLARADDERVVGQDRNVFRGIVHGRPV